MAAQQNQTQIFRFSHKNWREQDDYSSYMLQGENLSSLSIFLFDNPDESIPCRLEGYVWTVDGVEQINN